MPSFFVSVCRAAAICAGMALPLSASLDAQSYKVLAYYSGNPSTPYPPAVIAQSRGGYLVTTTAQDSGGFGEAFRVTTSGSVTTLHQFTLGETNHDPFSGLTLGRDGLFYGTTRFGGTSNNGTIFTMTADGVITTLHEFGDGPDLHPIAPPVQSLYGDFYGTTAGDAGNDEPASNPGSIYKIDSLGNYTLLHALTLDDGTNPPAQLVQSPTNFWFYGVAQRGGADGNGTIFRIDSEGDFQVLHNFTGSADGGNPVALIQANDGNFYGISSTGGAENKGVIFTMTPSNQVTALHTFTGNDGWAIRGSLLQGSDGYLYGTVSNGGAENEGTLFRVSTSGSNFTVLHSFHLASGLQPIALMQHTNGFFYGQTSNGGPQHGEYTYGVMFRLDMGLPPFVTFLNTYGRVGMTVDLLGDGFTTDSQVLFNGVPATAISDVENTFMKVVVPEGASTGPITVTTAKGLLTSNKVFVVRP
jgi:uncharacterized repeat protein (TIGR03803 family)